MQSYQGYPNDLKGSVLRIYVLYPFHFVLQVLKKFNLDGMYEGCTKVDGEHFEVEDLDDGPGAFHACLDVGLARTSTGARVFGAMKGAVDGGIVS